MTGGHRSLPWLMMLHWLLLPSSPGGGTAAAAPCPEPAPGARSEHQPGDRQMVDFDNTSPVDAILYWVNFEGEEMTNGALNADDKFPTQTFPGHLFYAREADTGKLMMVHRIRADERRIEVTACDDIGEPKDLDTSRWPEFERLAALGAQGRCVGPSANWSCVRFVPQEELEKRDPKEYGFTAEEARGTPYSAGTIQDHTYTSQLPYMPNVSAYDKGYLKMEMTDAMKAILYPWYQERLRDSVVKHDSIPGYYTNDHVVGMDRIDLDVFMSVREGISREMRQVLQWWTKMRLQPTQTFGLRLYRRDAMLINHLDRHMTHIASAVIQVGQRDLDEGWPLEIRHPHYPGLKEVYLQPGQMVLYEGGRVFHGRPMRFKGEEFGNIFSHFKPYRFKGHGDAVNPFYAAGFPKSQEL